jgi:hypothetical protein
MVIDLHSEERHLFDGRPMRQMGSESAPAGFPSVRKRPVRVGRER